MRKTRSVFQIYAYICCDDETFFYSRAFSYALRDRYFTRKCILVVLPHRCKNRDIQTFYINSFLLFHSNTYNIVILIICIYEK